VELAKNVQIQNH